GRKARSAMPNEGRVPVTRARMLGVLGIVAVVILAGLGWLLFKDAGKPAPSAAAPPAPAVGVRVASLKGVSQSFEFVGRVKAVNKVDVRARVEGFLEKE